MRFFDESKSNLSDIILELLREREKFDALRESAQINGPRYFSFSSIARQTIELPH